MSTASSSDGSVSGRDRAGDEVTAVVGGSGTGQLTAPAVDVGTLVSRYAVLEAIGAGGMGRVLRAYDPKLQREVALKEVLHGSLGREGAQRLVAEARAMAKLSHPNVVAIYDVEELSDRRLVLVMEYVPGGTLGEWASAETRPASEILQLFGLAGRGLAAAHASGLLHRDFKPANVLVSREVLTGPRSEWEADSVKVTDFGLAKLEENYTLSNDGGSTPNGEEALTAAGDVMGTPRYMAPEQHRGDPLTPAADQFAFCVALWEALTGTPPFAGANLATDKHAGPPSWPAGSRGDVPSAVVRAIERGLAPHPEDRWPNMRSLLAALAVDRSRRRWWWGAGAGCAAVAVGGWATLASSDRPCTGAADQLEGIWDEPTRASVSDSITSIGADYARTVAQSTVSALDAYTQTWAATFVDACEATTVRGEQSAAILDLRMTCLHRVKVDLAARVAVLRDADPEVVLRAHTLIEELPPIARCNDIAALQADVEPPRPEQLERVGAFRQALAEAAAARQAVRYDRARQSLARARAALEGVGYGPAETELALEQARLDVLEGRYQEADDAWQTGMQSAARHAQWAQVREATLGHLEHVSSFEERPVDAKRMLPLVAGLAEGDPLAEAEVAAFRGDIEFALGNNAEAEQWDRRALELQLQVLDPDDIRLAPTYDGLAFQALADGRHDEAEELFQRAYAILRDALGEDHPDAVGALSGIALSLHVQGRVEEAVAKHREVLRASQAALGPDHPTVAVSHHNIGATLSELGRDEEAEPELRESLRIRTLAFGPEHQSVADGNHTLAVILTHLGRLDEAAEAYRKALAIEEAQQRTNDAALARQMSDLGAVIAMQGDLAGAEQIFREALDRLGDDERPDPALEARLRFNLSQMLSEQGKTDAAWLEQARTLELHERVLPADHPNLALSRAIQAKFLLEQSRRDEALEHVEAALACPRLHDLPAPLRAEVAFVSAKVLWEASPGQRARARELARQGLEDYRAAPPNHAEAIEELETWIRTHR